MSYILEIPKNTTEVFPASPAYGGAQPNSGTYPGYITLYYPSSPSTTVSFGSNPSRTTYTAPVYQQLPAVLDVFVSEGLHVSSDDDKSSTYLTPRYSDSRGVGAKWGSNRVVIPPNVTSSQLVVGNFGFNIPPNAVIQSIEIEVDDSVVAGSTTAQNVGVLTCVFAPLGFNANIAGAWTNTPFGSTVTWNGTNWVVS